jgi:hypothetical protein
MGLSRLSFACDVEEQLWCPPQFIADALIGDLPQVRVVIGVIADFKSR